jgi:hypothetical protein
LLGVSSNFPFSGTFFCFGALHAWWMLRRKLLIYSNEVVISLEVIKTDSGARGARCLLEEKEGNLHVKIA